MTFFRLSTVAARVVRQVYVGPAVVSNFGVGWSCTVISVEIGEGGIEFCDVLQCFDELSLHAVSSEVMVLLVAVRVATVVRSLAVAVARFSMASTFSCW